jgi:hypothetical protein
MIFLILLMWSSFKSSRACLQIVVLIITGEPFAGKHRKSNTVGLVDIRVLTFRIKRFENEVCEQDMVNAAWRKRVYSLSAYKEILYSACFHILLSEDF